VPWPTDEWPTAPPPDGVDVAAIDAAADASFGAADNEARMRSLLVVDHGAIVYERYHPLDGPDTVFESFSVAKSITSALVGMIVDAGELDVDVPAPIEEWQSPGDERADITTADLLHMSSGLAWREDYSGGTVIPMFQSGDWAEYAIEQPLENEPGTVWKYSTGTTAILAEIVADEVGGPEALTDFIETRLEEPLGIESTTLLTDPTGQFAGGLGFDSTARDFARFGYLYLRGGLWDGERILSEDWIEYSATPSPTSTIYGAQWWLDGPPGTMVAKGLFGQFILVDPGHDLVIVSNATAGGDSWTPLQAAYDAFTADG
jgi:CubicO group peptidase (beta-lactamase class C family)